MEARPHPRQQERLHALRSYGLLDAPREADFDEIVTLTAAICEAPISVVNLIDAKRQFFLAEVGLGARETPLETSICSHVILEEDFVEITDTLADPRMADNPLCLAPDGGLRFYAGARLLSPDGLPLGTLCVLDTRPRGLSDLQRQAIRTLARQVTHQFELRRQLAAAEALRREIDHRVKNSLAAIASTVRLKARGAPADVRDALEDVGTRLHGVAALHHALEEADSFGRIDLGTYLERASGLLTAAAPPGLVMRVDVAPHRVDRITATAVATVLSEAVSNAVKHGLDPEGRGRIDIHGARDADAYALSVRNDVASDATTTGAPSLGMRIMRAVALQTGATLASGPEAGGWRVELRLPAE